MLDVGAMDAAPNVGNWNYRKWKCEVYVAERRGPQCPNMTPKLFLYEEAPSWFLKGALYWVLEHLWLVYSGTQKTDDCRHLASSKSTLFDSGYRYGL